ncbi:MAG: DUF6526 family protein [Ginsengibacter sp.]
MKEQNLKNHSRIVPAYHILLFLIVTACLISSIWNMYRAYEHHSGRLVAVALFGLCIAFFVLAWYARVFPLVAQDRAIRAEENLRHFALTGKLLNNNLTTPQVIALRFAEDTEFLLLAERAAKENMKPAEIKKAIVNWKPDHHRV